MKSILNSIKKALKRLFCRPKIRAIAENLLYEIDRGKGNQPARIFAKNEKDALNQFFNHYEKKTEGSSVKTQSEPTITKETQI